MKENNKKSKKILFFIIFLVFIPLCIMLLFFKNTSTNNVLTASSDLKNEESVFYEEPKSDTTISLASIGDIMCHNTQYWDAYNSSTGIYDFSYVFTDIKKYTESADITIGSLETSFAGEDRGYSNYPTFNSPDSLASAIKDIGVDILSTAGNHCLDMGFSGLSRTIDVLDNVGLKHLGTYKTQEDQEQILFQEVNGVKLAFINYTYGTNGIPIPEGKDFCVNLIDKDLIKQQIQLSKEERCRYNSSMYALGN